MGIRTHAASAWDALSGDEIVQKAFVCSTDPSRSSVLWNILRWNGIDDVRHAMNVQQISADIEDARNLERHFDIAVIDMMTTMGLYTGMVAIKLLRKWHPDCKILCVICPEAVLSQNRELILTCHFSVSTIAEWQIELSNKLRRMRYIRPAEPLPVFTS